MAVGETLRFHLLLGRKKRFRAASLLSKGGWGESKRQKRFMICVLRQQHCKSPAMASLKIKIILQCSQGDWEYYRKRNLENVFISN